MDRPQDLEERTAQFAEAVRGFVRGLPRTITNLEDVKQLARSSGSVAANCIEGNESLGPKDRVLKFRTCRKEAKESRLWLRLLYTGEKRRSAEAVRRTPTGGERTEAHFQRHRAAAGMKFGH